VSETGGTSASAGQTGSTGGEQGPGGQAGTTTQTASGGQTGATSGQAGTTTQTATGGQAEATGGQAEATGGQAGTTTQTASGGRAESTTQPGAGGQNGTAGQSGTAGSAEQGGSVVGSGGSSSKSGGTTGASGGHISSGGITSTGGLSSGGTTSSSGGSTSTSTSSGSTGGKADQGSLPAITVHLAGDSTMANYAATTTQEGWGQEFGQFFVSKVTIDNQAQGGANVQTFYSGKWKTLIANVQAGDYVMAAFGINDSGTTHGPVTVPNFTAELSTMADEVAAKKATFIPTTSSPLQVWVGGKETNDRLQQYCDATIAVGKTKNLLVDDLNARGVEYYNSIGETAAGKLEFNGDKAHFDKAGATEMAQLAAQELTRIGSPLAAYLK
jgi:hypothetical protein